MAVAYRTKMTISPTQNGRDNAIMLKSDHFLKDLSPKHLRYQNYNKKKWVEWPKSLVISCEFCGAIMWTEFCGVTNPTVDKAKNPRKQP